MEEKQAKPVGRFTNNSKGRLLAAAKKTGTSKKSVLNAHEEMLSTARKSPPPQSWFDEDITKLRRKP